MNNGQAGWIILFLFALILIMIGVQGSLGQIVAVLFCPQYIQITQE